MVPSTLIVCSTAWSFPNYSSEASPIHHDSKVARSSKSIMRWHAAVDGPKTSMKPSHVMPVAVPEVERHVGEVPTSGGTLTSDNVEPSVHPVDEFLHALALRLLVEPIDWGISALSPELPGQRGEAALPRRFSHTPNSGSVSSAACARLVL